MILLGSEVDRSYSRLVSRRPRRVHVAPGRDEHLEYPHVPVLGRLVRHQNVAAAVERRRRRDVGPRFFEEELHHVGVTGVAGGVQRRPAILEGPADFSPGFHEAASHCHVAVLDS